MNQFSIILILISFISINIHAETMRGGSYTLNGSVDVMVNQSQGGSYRLNPNGDSIAPNSTGGTFVLYPTPYSRPDPVIAAVIQTAMYGAGDYAPGYYNNSFNSTSTSPQGIQDKGNFPVTNIVNNNPRNPTRPDAGLNNSTNVGVDGGNSSGYYNGEGEFVPSNTDSKYGYSNNSFGASNNGKNSTSTKKIEKRAPQFVITFFTWLIPLLLILFVLKRIWKRLRGNI